VTLEAYIYTGEEALRVQNHGRRHLVSIMYNAFAGPVRNMMAAQCLLSSVSKPLGDTSVGEGRDSRRRRR